MKALLPRANLEAFKAAMAQRGYVEDELRAHEALRMVHPNRQPGDVPIILYYRAGSQLLSYNHTTTGTLVVKFKESQL